MNRLLTALALCVPLYASAADLTISCIGPESDDCPVAVDVVTDSEAFIATFLTRKEDGTFERNEVSWCTGFNIGGGGPYRWLPLSQGPCFLSGRHRTVNGELTKRQLAESSISFSTQRYEALCNTAYDTMCKEYPPRPPRAKKFSLSCIGPSSPDCPVSLEVKLEGEELIAGFVDATAGTRRTVKLEWCSHLSITGDAPFYWQAFTESICPAWDNSRQINGELTMRQLAERGAWFETRRIEATCRIDVVGPSGKRPVCSNVQR